MSANITAYSTAVGPSSETRKRCTFLARFFIASSGSRASAREPNALQVVGSYNAPGCRPGQSRPARRRAGEPANVHDCLSHLQKTTIGCVSPWVLPEIAASPLAAHILSAAGLAATLARRRSLALRPGLATGLPLSRMMTQQARSCEAPLSPASSRWHAAKGGQEKRSFAGKRLQRSPAWGRRRLRGGDSTWNLCQLSRESKKVCDRGRGFWTSWPNNRRCRPETRSRAQNVCKTGQNVEILQPKLAHVASSPHPTIGRRRALDLRRVAKLRRGAGRMGGAGFDRARPDGRRPAPGAVAGQVAATRWLPRNLSYWDGAALAD